MISPLVRRRDAAQACIDRFNGRPLDWGSVDCAKIAGHLLHKLGIKQRILKGATYRSEIGAIKHLRTHGHAKLADAVDAVGLPPIPPAMAVVGDLLAMPVEGELWDCALVVAVGNGRVLGVYSDGVVRVMQPQVPALFAWRCDPCQR